jgi:beta-glucosidase
MARMTVDEKIGQLNLPTSGDITTGAANSSDVAKNIEEGKVGGLISSRLKRLKKYKGSLLKSRLKSHCFWDGRDSWLRNYFSFP